MLNAQDLTDLVAVIKKLSAVSTLESETKLKTVLTNVFESMAKSIADTAEGVDSAALTAAILAINPHSTYKALLSQASTSAPTSLILGTNGIGTITLARTSAGIYTLTKTGAFTTNKTHVTISSGYVTAADKLVEIQAVLTSANVITITSNLLTFDGDGVMTKTPTDALIALVPITIEVYP